MVHRQNSQSDEGCLDEQNCPLRAFNRWISRMFFVLVDHLDLQHGIYCALKCLKRYGRWRTKVFDLLSTIEALKPGIIFSEVPGSHLSWEAEALKEIMFESERLQFPCRIWASTDSRDCQLICLCLVTVIIIKTGGVNIPCLLPKLGWIWMEP